MESLASLILWVSVVTGLPTAPAPAIKYTDWQNIQDAAALVYEGPVRAHGYYVPGTVVLPDDWDHDSLRDRSVKVHELVHHLQRVSGKKYRCRGEKEREAFAVQQMYVDLHRPGTDVFWLMRIRPPNFQCSP